MKKSKIIGLSLGAVALTTVAVVTPVILSSCGDSVITDVLVSDNAITLPNGYDTQKYELVREKGTNNFNFNVTVTNESPEWTENDLNQLRETHSLLDLISKEKLLSLGFDKDAVKISTEGPSGQGRPSQENISKILEFTFGVHDSKGNIKYPDIEKVEANKNVDRTKSAVVYDTFKIVQIDYSKLPDLIKPGTEPNQAELEALFPKLITKEVVVAFKLTVNPIKK